MESRERSPSDFQITVVGLGLIGGSFAYALHGFENATVTGFDADAQVMEKARKSGAVDRTADNIKEALLEADLVVFCVYPHHVMEILKNNAECFKKGAVVTDVCGVKTHLYREIGPYIPKGVDYIGVHPMAGKEVDGFDNADGELFIHTGFIIIPLSDTKPESVDLMKKMAAHIGAKRVSVCDIEEHDAIIAYTSDLMHISASALCMDFHPHMTLAFTAGAYRDCTRIANINPGLWTELLLENANHTLTQLDLYIENLNRIRNALAGHDADSLYRYLDRVRTNKKEMLTR